MKWLVRWLSNRLWVCKHPVKYRRWIAFQHGGWGVFCDHCGALLVR